MGRISARTPHTAVVWPILIRVEPLAWVSDEVLIEMDRHWEGLRLEGRSGGSGDRLA